MSLEEYNFWSDRRTQEAMKKKLFKVDGYRVKLADWVKEILDLRAVEYDERTIAIKYEVCTLCSGKGKVVNPSIDASGFSPYSQLDLEDYLSGHYDVTCPRCEGLRVEAFPKFTGELKKAMDEIKREEEDYVRTVANELKMGC